MSGIRLLFTVNITVLNTTAGQVNYNRGAYFERSLGFETPSK